MPPEHSSDVKFEIGHVLFIDIVGYSKLLINEQSVQIQRLNDIVRGTAIRVSKRSPKKLSRRAKLVKL
jgi:hypothetical protein